MIRLSCHEGGRIGLIRKRWLPFLVSPFLFPMACSAEYSFELTPSISVSRDYDDNIYLDDSNEQSDYLTTVSPGINLTISSLNNLIGLDYSPTWVWYDDEDQNDTVRHSGTLTLGQDFTERMRFELTDTYLKSEEPIEETEQVEGVRRTRDTYQRNTANASLSYQFGPENALTIGYMHSLLENEDVTIDDGTIQNPFAAINYWFDVRNGLELNYELTEANFSRDDGSEAGDDYKGHSAGLRYIYRFSAHTRGSIGYDFTNRNFDGLTEDYTVQEGSIDFQQEISPNLSVSAGGGYFAQANEQPEDETGYTYNASLTKRFERGSFTLGGRGGWDESYLEAERRGFIRFWSAETRLEYQLREPFGGYLGASYRKSRDQDNREWNTSQVNCGVRWNFLRWFYLALSYAYSGNDDDVDTEEYTDNQVMLTLNASKPYTL